MEMEEQYQNKTELKVFYINYWGKKYHRKSPIECEQTPLLYI